MDNFSSNISGEGVTPAPVASSGFEGDFQFLFFCSRDALVMVDALRETVEEINSPACSMTGRAREEWEGALFFRIFQGKDWDRLRGCLAAGVGEMQDILLIRKDGSVCPVEMMFKKMGGHSGSKVLILIRDLTSRHLAEKQSNLSEDKYRLIVEMASEGIVTLDREQRITFANEKMALMLGYGMDELLGQPLTSFCAETDRAFPGEKVPNRTWAAFGQYDSRLIRKSGGDVWVLATGHPILDASGDSWGSLMMFTDITERKEAERKMRHSQEFFRSLIDSSLDMIIATDPNRNIIEFNRAAEECFGYRSEEVLGKPADLLYADPKDGPSVASTAVSQGGYVKEVVNRRKNGTLFPSVVSASVLRDSNGNLLGVMGVSRDITERKQTEEQLRLLSSAIRDTLEPILIIDCRLKVVEPEIIFANTAFFRLTGFAQSDIFGCSPSVLFGEKSDAQFFPRLTQSVSKGQPFVGETVNYRKDGSEIGLEWHVSPVHDEFNRVAYIVGVLRDVTELRKMEAERMRASKLEAIGLLAAGLGHDFNNLLTAITGNVSVARSRLSKDDPCYPLLQDAETGVRQASSLARQLLTFSKGGTPVKQAVAIGRVLRDRAEFILHGSKVRAVFDLPEDLWLVEVDEDQIGQVVDNLVINAMQAMTAGGGLHISSENLMLPEKNPGQLVPGRYVRFSVQDEGCGIPASILSKIFDPYFTTKPTGSGLGLATIYSIVRKHQGWITVESEVNKGTTFIVYLKATEKMPEAKVSDEDAIHRGSGRVLIMDDEALIRRTLRNMLQSLGYQTQETQNGAEALAVYESALKEGNPFDFVTLDLTVPGGLGGADIIKPLREMHPQAKVLACSGYSNDPVISDFESYGFSGALMKPFDVQHLSRVLLKLGLAGK